MHINSFPKECSDQLWCTAITFLHKTQIIKSSQILEFRWPWPLNEAGCTEFVNQTAKHGHKPGILIQAS